jgi:ABC-type molybdate transport system substrate-binding protein
VSKTSKPNKVFASLSIILTVLGLTYAPIPGSQITVTVVSGTELLEPLQVLESKFEQEHPNIKLELKFQGSQEMIDRCFNERDDFKPTVLIPANGIILTELSDRSLATGKNEPFYNSPQPIAKTMLVGIAWSDRAAVLFPDGKWNWQRIEAVMLAENWVEIGGANDWGSFDFLTTDPTRSNSGQMTFELWARSQLGQAPTNINLNSSAIGSLFALVKQSVYQPSRSTDILLQEFIARGPNDADVATTYESIALHRWEQSGVSQSKPYKIFYPNPTIETTATAAILRHEVDEKTAASAQKFLDFLEDSQQQKVFVQYGFRSIDESIALKSVVNSPWTKNIPGIQVQPNVEILSPSDERVNTEIVKLWERND